jgi:hypothetical protein
MSEVAGPWRVAIATEGYIVTRDVRADSKYTTWSDAIDRKKELNAAERLRDAASDLLAELQANREKLIELRDRHLDHAATVVRALVQKRIEAADAAIAKAKGEA